jgi:uncharacterized protein (UPF0297 family)
MTIQFDDGRAERYRAHAQKVREILEHVNQIGMDDGYVRIHQVLVDVLKEGDPVKIQQATREHILNAWFPPPYAP